MDTDRRKELFQKHEVVITIVLAVLLQFTAIAKLIPAEATAPDYALRIMVVSCLCLAVLLEIWITRRIGFWLLSNSNDRELYELKRSVVAWVLLIALFIAFDCYLNIHYGFGGFPISVLMVVWLLSYMISGTVSRTEGK